MLALMTLDFAYLKSFKVEWKSPIAALESEGVASDDDDESFHVDTSSWVVTYPDSVPLKDIKIPEKGKLQAHIVCEASIWG